MRRTMLAAMAGLMLAAAPAAMADPTIFHGALNGHLLNFAIDRTGTEGMLGEYIQLGQNDFETAIETFDLSTGAIVATIRHRNHGPSDFIPLTVRGDHTGLFLFEKTNRETGLIREEIYQTIAPMTANTVTGTWTPPLGPRNTLTAVSGDLSTNTTVFLAQARTQDDHLYLFSTDVAANTFGPRWKLPSNQFPHNSSRVEYDPVTGNAILASDCFHCAVPLYTADLSTGARHKFAHVGGGGLTGMAIDPSDRILCTTSQDDFSIEFTNLTTNVTQTFVLPNATSTSHIAGFVGYDAAHNLFVVGQEHSTTGHGNIYLYAPNGTLSGTIAGVDAHIWGFNSTLRKAYGFAHTSDRDILMVSY